MEHRHYKRIAASKSVVVYWHGQLIARGRVRNFSGDGVFVEIAGNIRPLHNCVEVKLIAREKSVGDEHLLRAIVVHQSKEGIGLMLTTISDMALSIDDLFDEKSEPGRESGPLFSENLS